MHDGSKNGFVSGVWQPFPQVPDSEKISSVRGCKAAPKLRHKTQKDFATRYLKLGEPSAKLSQRSMSGREVMQGKNNLLPSGESNNSGKLQKQTVSEEQSQRAPSCNETEIQIQSHVRQPDARNQPPNMASNRHQGTPTFPWQQALRAGNYISHRKMSPSQAEGHPNYRMTSPYLLQYRQFVLNDQAQQHRVQLPSHLPQLMQPSGNHQHRPWCQQHYAKPTQLKQLLQESQLNAKSGGLSQFNASPGKQQNLDFPQQAGQCITKSPDQQDASVDLKMAQSNLQQEKSENNPAFHNNVQANSLNMPVILSVCSMADVTNQRSDKSTPDNTGSHDQTKRPHSVLSEEPDTSKKRRVTLKVNDSADFNNDEESMCPNSDQNVSRMNFDPGNVQLPGVSNIIENTQNSVVQTSPVLQSQETNVQETASPTNSSWKFRPLNENVSRNGDKSSTSDAHNSDEVEIKTFISRIKIEPVDEFSTSYNQTETNHIPLISSTTTTTDETEGGRYRHKVYQSSPGQISTQVTDLQDLNARNGKSLSSVQNHDNPPQITNTPVTVPLTTSLTSPSTSSVQIQSPIATSHGNQAHQIPDQFTYNSSVQGSSGDLGKKQTIKTEPVDSFTAEDFPLVQTRDADCYSLISSASSDKTETYSWTNLFSFSSESPETERSSSAMENTALHDEGPVRTPSACGRYAKCPDGVIPSRSPVMAAKICNQAMQSGSTLKDKGTQAKPPMVDKGTNVSAENDRNLMTRDFATQTTNTANDELQSQKMKKEVSKTEKHLTLEGKPHCKDCKVWYQSVALYMLHRACHLPGHQFQCRKCQIKFEDAIAFNEHILKPHFL
ncbi:mucin-4-like [Ptychodera flava]|uniref:mucin-4-like n=1 Tax=Ptychodera flava TaxID=63121 RepID=UPI00396A7CD7